MRFDYYTAAVFGLFGAALSLDANFDPINKPTKGETIQAGSLYTIEWEKSTESYSGPINILLRNNETTYSAGFEEVISAHTPSSAGKYRWNVTSRLPTSDKYYLRIGSINDASIFNQSPLFKIKGSNDSAHTTAITAKPTTTMMTTSTAASSPTGSNSTGPISTSTGAGSAATPAVAAAFAYVGAAAVGMLAF
ncbi:hypothetical protein N7474_004681 [Penicillium riverlandense]|uniref:uncharacterized protein n=1 Tax=Penicillium riverlandense TaxID=1903569 RepID=UPI0025474C83|nr:uncharacterized protein N7474_004681 [Penicillium riverlandense]KAJ5819090.1 hypothetical protein N7474_004681 [Penicillium riverlandense]